MGMETWTDSHLDACLANAEKQTKHYEVEADGFKKYAAELNAEKARRDAEAKKTVGQRVAEKIVDVWSDRWTFHYSEPIKFPNGPTVNQITICDFNNESGESIQKTVAAAIDKVRADTIEECAKVAKEWCSCPNYSIVRAIYDLK